MAKEWKNTKEYFITYSILINAAKHKGVATYQEIAQACGLPTVGAIAVGVNGKPGPGFITWARDLGAYHDEVSEEDFFVKECAKIYEEWKTTYRISTTKE